MPKKSKDSIINQFIDHTDAINVEIAGLRTVSYAIGVFEEKACSDISWTLDKIIQRIEERSEAQYQLIKATTL